MLMSRNAGERRRPTLEKASITKAVQSSPKGRKSILRTEKGRSRGPQLLFLENAPNKGREKRGRKEKSSASQKTRALTIRKKGRPGISGKNTGTNRRKSGRTGLGEEKKKRKEPDGQQPKKKNRGGGERTVSMTPRGGWGWKTRWKLFHFVTKQRWASPNYHRPGLGERGASQGYQ